MAEVREFIIEKHGDEWWLISETTGRVLGKHRTKREAILQEELIKRKQRGFAMPEPTYNISGVEIMRTGKANGIEITEQDLADMETAFKELDFKPPLKAGHVKDKPGMPALGWIESLRREGSKLIADLSHLPKQVYEAIKARRYDTVSAEVFFNLERGGKKFRRALKALALLGADIPAVAGLKPLHETVFDAEHEKVENVDCVIVFEDMEDKTMPDPAKNQDIEALQREIKELSDKLTAKTLENDELRKKDQEDKKRLEQQLFAMQEEARKAKIQNKLSGLKIPALRDHLAVCYELAMGSTETVEFSLEEGKTEKVSPEAVVDQLVKHLNEKAEKLFTEMSTESGSTDHGGAYDDVGEEVDAKVREFCQKHGKSYDKDYREVLFTVLDADPDLKERYAARTQ